MMVESEIKNEVPRIVYLVSKVDYFHFPECKFSLLMMLAPVVVVFATWNRRRCVENFVFQKYDTLTFIALWLRASQRLGSGTIPSFRLYFVSISRTYHPT